MNTQLVFARTGKGNDELSARTYHLPRKLRTVLILVDGKSGLAQLHAKAMGLSELEGSLEQIQQTWQLCGTFSGRSCLEWFHQAQHALVGQAPRPGGGPS